MRKISNLLVMSALVLSSSAWAGFVSYEAAAIDAAGITPTRDAFRAAVGGGTVAGANGSFGGLRREINWDGVPDTAADPNPFPANFFNTTSPRGVAFSTPGTGFLVSANGGSGQAPLFGFATDFQAFSAQRIFTAVNSNITTVSFFDPGTSNAATTSAFGLVFVDVEVASTTQLEFFDTNGLLLYQRFALVSGNQGLSFLGAVADAGERISQVRITAGANTITSNGVLGDPNSDVVAMDDFLFAEPLVISTAVPEPSSLALVFLGLAGALVLRRRIRRSAE